MRLLRSISASVLALAATFGVASAQDMPVGRVYTFHSSAQGGCPALDWHVVVGAGGTLSGMIAWNNMQSMARATGSVNGQARTFSMTAKEVGGKGRTATVSGTVGQNGWLNANIKGPNVNCENINVPWFAPGTSGGANG
jgi:hypothetical protein